MTARLIFGLFLILLAVACTSKPKPASLPAPPPIKNEPPKPHKIAPGPNDRIIHKCTVTKQNKDSVDCLCRGLSTKIDSNTGEQSLECKVSPGKEIKRAKH
jgi:hypothetical protein